LTCDQRNCATIGGLSMPLPLLSRDVLFGSFGAYRVNGAYGPMSVNLTIKCPAGALFSRSGNTGAPATKLRAGVLLRPAGALQAASAWLVNGVRSAQQICGASGVSEPWQLVALMDRGNRTINIGSLTPEVSHPLDLRRRRCAEWSRREHVTVLDLTPKFDPPLAEKVGLRGAGSEVGRATERSCASGGRAVQR
jgi:hypothetical protein